MSDCQVSILDVAKYVLEKCGTMTTMKLQKLCYYSQAWTLVWEESRLFPDRIEAWANGPVSPMLYQKHRGKFTIDANELKEGDSTKLSSNQKHDVDKVLDFYGPMSGYELSQLTHHEDPWRNARGNCPSGARCQEQITESAMAEYYDGLVD